MITLRKNDKTIEIAKLVEGKKRTPIYWHPTEQSELMNSVTDIHHFNDEYFRDQFELSEQQAIEIFSGLAEDTVVEKHQKKYSPSPAKRMTPSIGQATATKSKLPLNWTKLSTLSC
mgnify:CR=1 FL=1